MVESNWSVKKFLSQYTAKNTINMYKSSLSQFFALVYPELKKTKNRETRWEKLNQLSVQYFSEDRDIREDIISFRDSLTDKAPKTKIAYLAPIFRFLEDNGQTFPRNFIKNINGKASDAITKEHVPNAEELKRIFEYLPIQAKSLAIILSSSGMRIGEALKLKVSDIDLDKNPVKISIPYEITKTKKGRIAFISTEAKEIVEEWLSYRPEFIQRANRRGLSKRKVLTDTNDPRLFPFSTQTFQGHWRSALDKANLLEIDHGRITIRPHNLRKFFRTHGEWTRPEIAEALMGHQAGLNAVYARYDQAEETLAEEYLKVESSLSIFSHSSTMIKLQEKVDRQSDDIQELITNLSIKNVRLSADVKDLREENKKSQADVKDLREIVDSLLKYSEMLEEQYEIKESLSGPDEPVIEKAQVSEDELKSQFRERKDKMKGLREKEQK